MTEETILKKEHKTGAGPGAWAFIFVAALAAAFFIYTYRNLGNFDFSSSELPYVKAAAESSFSKVFSSLVSSNRPAAVHAAALRVAVKLAGGVSVVSLRLPSAVFAALCIIFFFTLARRLFPDGLSVLAAAAFAFSPALLSFAMDAGPYALFLLSNLISCRLLLGITEKMTPARKFLLFASLLAAFDTSFYTAFTLPAGCIIILSEIARGKKAGLPRNGAAGKPIADAAFYYTAAAAVVYIYYLGFGLSRIPPSTIWNADIPFARWVGILFIGASGGSAAVNAPLAGVIFLLALFGAVNLRRHRPLSFRAVFYSITATSVLIAIYFVSRIHTTEYPEMAAHLGFATAIPAPFVSMLFAAALYYYFVTTFRRDALSVFTVGLLLRITITSVFILVISVFAFYFTGTSIRQISTMERENWPTAAKYLADWTRDGDVLLYHWQDSEPVEYFIRPRLEKSSANSGGPETPVTWLVRMDPRKGFGIKEELLNRIYASEGNKLYKGLHGDINIVYIGATVVAGRADITVKTGGGGTTEPRGRTTLNNKTTYTCSPNGITCRFRLYFMESDTYDISVAPRGAAAAPPGIFSICGEKEPLVPQGGGSYLAELSADNGYCDVEISSPGESGGYDISLHKKTTSSFDLFYSMRIEKNVHATD